jgi:hypothetical protein
MLKSFISGEDGVPFKDPDIVGKFNEESTPMKDGQDEMKTMENQIDNLIKTKNAKLYGGQ